MNFTKRVDRAMVTARTERDWLVVAFLVEGDETKARFQLQTEDTEFNREPCGRTVFPEPGGTKGFVTNDLTLEEVEVILGIKS